MAYMPQQIQILCDLHWPEVAQRTEFRGTPETDPPQPSA